MRRTNMLLYGLLTWAGVLVLCLLLVALLGGRFKWRVPTDSDNGKIDWRQDQCEAMRLESVVREPQNTWSNFAYVLAGILILYRAQHPLGRAVGAQLCVLFLFSGMYHASVLEPWQTLDIAGVYGVLVAMVVFALHGMFSRFGNLAPDPIFTWALIAGTFIAAIIMALLRTKIIIFDSTWGFVGLVVILTVLVIIIFGFALANPQKYHDFLAGVGVSLDNVWLELAVMLGVAGIGFFFRLSDGKGHKLCSPHAVVQAHALWHVLSGLALLLAYDFFARLSSAPARVFAGPRE